MKENAIYSKDLISSFSHGNLLGVLKDILLILSTLLPPSWTKALAHFFNSAPYALSFLPIIVFGLFVLFILFLIRLALRIKRTLQEPTVLLEVTPPARTEKASHTTQKFFEAIYDLRIKKSFKDRLLGTKVSLSFEIASNRNQGIRYLIRTSTRDVNNVKKHLLSYLTQAKVKVVNEYLPESDNLKKYHTKVIELKLLKHSAYPLQKQDNLELHDPVAYITGMMTKLLPGELISLQMILTPGKLHDKKLIKRKITRNEDVLSYLDGIHLPIWVQVILIPFKLIGKLLIGCISGIGGIGKTILDDAVDPKMAQRQAQMRHQMQYLMSNIENKKPARVITPFEQQAIESIAQKIEQRLFQTRIRLLIAVSENEQVNERENGFISSLAAFIGQNDQSLVRKFNLNFSIFSNYLYFNFKKRLLSLIFQSSPSLLSISEVSDLYHFPFTRMTQTENIVKSQSRELPAPLTLKQGRKMAVIFGNNIYGEEETPIGLTAEERKTHMYIIGRTGSGKTTLLFSMAKHDIEHGEGLAFIDPHGDVSEDLLACIPDGRINDLIYLNPRDLKQPIGINLLELTPGLDEDEAELEKEVVCEGVISLFRKVFSKDENVNAHRIEHILRNTIYTAFTVKDCTLFTINKILTDPDFRNGIIPKLEDEDLANFWKNEFGKAGDYQVVKMTQGVTAKVGRFLRSPTAKRILEQPKSTINFSEILDKKKILICNFSQGRLGEDTAQLMGITVLTKIQQAALKRADIPVNKRIPFHLYVDEFQNFATQAFTKMLSEGRKYGLEVYIAEQSTSQQQDRTIVNIILANVTTIVCFRSGNPVDEELMLAQFAPLLEQGELMNLSRYHFYIKISALESELPFSGETIKVDLKKNPKKIEKLIKASQKNWAIVYKKPEVNKQPETTNQEDNYYSKNNEERGEIGTLS